eukprot:6095332-Alexandrium_andersonii.AAC.1
MHPSPHALPPALLRIGSSTRVVAVTARAHAQKYSHGFPGGLRPLDPPEKRPRRTRRPVSLSPSDSARKMMPTPLDEALQ